MKVLYNKHKNIKEEALVVEPVIIRVTKFNEDGYDKFRKQMSDAHNTVQTVIPVVIDSFGGEAYTLMGMISIIQSSKFPVATIIESKAMSCAAILFTFGTSGMRYMSPTATIMIHDVASMSYGKIEEVKADTKEGDRLNTLVFKMMAENCGQPKNYFKDLVHARGHSDWYLTPRECKKHKIANHLYVPDMEVNIKMDFKIQ